MRGWRHLVDAALAARMAALEPMGGEVAAAERPVAVERLQRIDGTGGRETATRAQPGTEEEAVEMHQALQEPRRPSLEKDEAPHDRPAARKRRSSSARTAVFRAADAALGNCAMEKGAFKRRNQSPAAKERPCCSKAARACRRIKLRVTARRACRLGTT